MRDTLTKPNKCLICGYKLNCVTDLLSDHTPSPGDFTVCLKCGAVMQFAADLTVECLDEEHLAILANDPAQLDALIQIVGAVKLIQARQKGARN